MDGNRRWLGWIAIGLSGLALLVAFFGRGLGPLGPAAGLDAANAPQVYAQPGAGPQGAGPQRGQVAPGPNAQPGAGPQGAGPQRGAGRPGGADFGLGGWFRFPLRLIGGSFQVGMLALLALLGWWLIRGRTAGGAA